MNEIKKIHLGRQAFTIAVDAYAALHEYLDAIKVAVGKNEDVLEEVELRMAELLHERGVTTEKVVLKADIEFLKEQLGRPEEFIDSEDAKTSAEANAQPGPGPRRLFRDPERGMLAGVAAGIGAYLGIEPIIVRFVFVLLTLSGAAGVFIYLVLWFLMPAAKTESERLQLRGQAVTVGSIKQAVEAADVPAAARRAERFLYRLVRMVAELVLTFGGALFVLVGMGVLAGTTAWGVYLLNHGVQLGSAVLFPLGKKEVLLVVSGLVVAAVAAVLSALVGQALVRRKWSVPGWIMAALVGLAVLGLAAGSALGAEVAPTVNQRYQTVQHSEWRHMPVFTQAHLNLGDVRLETKNDASYGVEIRTLGEVNTSGIKTTVIGGNGGQLDIDASHFAGPAHRCEFICPYGPTNTEVVIHGPLPFRDPDANGIMNFDPQIAPPDAQKLMMTQEAVPTAPATPKP